MDDPHVWLMTMIKAPEQGSGVWQMSFGGAGSYDILVRDLKANIGDVWDNFYEYALLEEVVSGVVVPGQEPLQRRWFTLLSHDGDYSNIEVVECSEPQGFMGRRRMRCVVPSEMACRATLGTQKIEPLPSESGVRLQLQSLTQP